MAEGLRPDKKRGGWKVLIAEEMGFSFGLVQWTLVQYSQFVILHVMDCINHWKEEPGGGRHCWC